MSDRRRFGNDERGVSEVLGAVLVFGLAISLVVLLQVTTIPQANERVEFQHSLEVQEDLQHMRGAIVNAGADEDTYSATIQKGTTYPSRLLFLNPPSPSGTLRTVDIGAGEYQSGGVDLESICGFGGPDALSTKAIEFQPDYNHFSDESPHRYENTLYYQDPDGSGILNRTGQTFVRPDARVISLYPLQGEFQESGYTATTIDFVGGKAGRDDFDDFTITIPTNLSASQWQDFVSGADVTISSNPSANMVDFEFDGTWTVRCHTVGINDAPNQPTPPHNPPPPGSGGSNPSNTINPPTPIILDQATTSGHIIGGTGGGGGSVRCEDSLLGGQCLVNITLTHPDSSGSNWQINDMRYQFYIAPGSPGSGSRDSPPEHVNIADNECDVETVDYQDDFQHVSSLGRIDAGETRTFTLNFFNPSDNFETVEGDGAILSMIIEEVGNPGNTRLIQYFIAPDFDSSVDSSCTSL